jgi:NH3-dependent NAD+ synthetase
MIRSILGLSGGVDSSVAAAFNSSSDRKSADLRVCGQRLTAS